MKERKNKAESCAILRRDAGNGTHTAMMELLGALLREAREEMETATDTTIIWRAQGRVVCIRDIITAITPKKQRDFE